MVTPTSSRACGWPTASGVWTFRCDDDGAMRLRFAGADLGDDPDAGRITEFAEQPSIVAACSNTTVSINPQTGKKVKQ